MCQSEDYEWVFGDECPECGEREHLVAYVTEFSDNEPVKARLMCGGWSFEKGEAVKIDEMGEGCGNRWDWRRD